jgi:IclR family transcriptional regulator, pca regulon regulatory protein
MEEGISRACRNGARYSSPAAAGGPGLASWPLDPPPGLVSRQFDLLPGQRTRQPQVSRLPAMSGIVKDPGGWQTSLPSQERYSGSLERGLAILGCFTAGRPVLGIAEIAAEVGMTRSTTDRYVRTLLALGYLERYVQQGSTRKYRLGLAVTDLGMSALSATGLRDHAHSYLVELRSHTSCTVSLGVLDGGEVLFVDRVRGLPVRGRSRGQQEIDLNLDVGSRVPAHASSIGKLLLANLPGPEQDLMLQMPLSRLAARTITSGHTLRAELDRIAVEAFAVEEEELMNGVRSIAAPVCNGTRQVVAAVAVEAPISIVSRAVMVNALGQHLLATADHISSRLGYRHDEEPAPVPPRSAPSLRVITP